MISRDRPHVCKISFGLLAPQLNRVTYLLLIAITVALPCNILMPQNQVMAQTIAQSPTLSKKTIYVNPEAKTESQTGKKTSPFQTITQALEVAKPGSTIQLAAGTYSEATGESFPIVIDDRITLQGDPRNQGYKTIIRGDGYFISPTGAGQNVTIAAIEDAGTITGVTVTNDHSRGHGIWIESASPQIIHNTLTRNGNTGVSLNGKSSPRIENNYFYNNSGNGLLVYGTSEPEVTNNTFEQTGFGISLVQNSVAKVADNLFDGNRIGIILEGNARGTFRNNEIINSEEYGLTAIAQSSADLGTDEESGGNIFRSNKKLDIQNATDREILAVGTEIQGDTQGKIDFDRGTFQVAANPTNPSIFQDLPPLPSRRNVTPSPLPALTPASSNIPDETPSNLPAPPPVIASSTGNKELVFTPSSSDVRMVLDIEPVPYPPDVKSSVAYSPPAQIKYKVLVEVLDNSEENEVRSLYPEAFKTIYQGEPWLQVGAFSNWDKAKRAEQNLIDLGLGTYLID